MPIYEYCCNRCQRRCSLFVRSIGASVQAACPHCGSQDMRRLISRVAILRSEEDTLEGLADDASLADVDEKDPRSVARWVRRMSKKMGEPLDAEMAADLEQMEAGEMPEDFDDGSEEETEEESILDEA